MKRLQLKGQAFNVYKAATSNEISAFWEILLQIDSSLTEQDTIKHAIKNKTDLQKFLEHCCVFWHYSFQIKKCGSDDSELCKSVRLSVEPFSSLHFLPDLTPVEDGRYLSFEKTHGKSTIEEHRPSLTKKSKSHSKSIGFYASQQHVKNVDMVIQCEECEMWRLLYC